MHPRTSFVQQMQIQLQQYEEERDKKLQQRTFYRNRNEKEKKAKETLIHLQQNQNPIYESNDQIEGWYNRTKQRTNKQRSNHISANISFHTPYESPIIPRLKVLLSQYESPISKKKNNHEFMKSSSTIKTRTKTKIVSLKTNIALKSIEDEQITSQQHHSLKNKNKEKNSFKDTYMPSFKNQEKIPQKLFQFKNNELPYFPQTQNTHPPIYHNFTNSKRSMNQKTGRKGEGRIDTQREILQQLIAQSMRQPIKDSFSYQFNKPRVTRRSQFMLNNILN